MLFELHCVDFVFIIFDYTVDGTQRLHALPLIAAIKRMETEQSSSKHKMKTSPHNGDSPVKSQ